MEKVFCTFKKLNKKKKLFQNLLYFVQLFGVRKILKCKTLVNDCCFLLYYFCFCLFWLCTNFNLFSIFRLWAEVFHVSSSGTGTVKWQQVSEDLVPVNITCIQDSPECVFHITAYNSQVDKILDVRLIQPG